MSKDLKKTTPLFAKLPKAIRIKKSILICTFLLGTFLMLVILVYLPTSNPTLAAKEVIDNDAEESHWLAASTTKQLSSNEINLNKTTLDNKNKEDEESKELTIRKDQEDHLATALNELEAEKTNKLHNLEANNESEKNAYHSPITVSSQSMNNSEHENGKGDSFISNLSLPAGTSIPIQFLSEVNSELPGFALATVSRNVSNEQGQIIIPQGSKVLLQYESANEELERLAYRGVSITLPNGKIITLPSTPVVDQSGHTGLSDKANHHYVKNLFRGLGSLSTNTASQIAASKLLSPSDNNLNMFYALPSSNTELKATTFYIRAGFACNLLLTQELIIN
jgi:type IV secretory pathway VirB10-like protein